MLYSINSFETLYMYDFNSDRINIRKYYVSYVVRKNSIIVYYEFKFKNKMT